MRWIYAYTILIGFSFSFLGCSKNESNGKTFSLRKDSTVVTLKTFAPQVQGYGRIVSVRSQNLIARFNGVIHLPSRTLFQQGQTIYKLTGADIDLERKKLNTLLADAKARYDFAYAVYQRKKKLIEKKVLAPKDRDAIIYDYRSAQEDLKRAQAELNYFLQMTDYKAPYDGYLSAVAVNQNDYVQKGQTLATFQGRSKIKLIGTLYGDSATFVKQGNTLKIVLNKKTEVSAKITFWEQTINLQSGGRTFWAEIDSVPPALKPGDYVRYTLKGPAFRAPAVPASALILEKGHYYAVICVNSQYRNAPVLPGINTRGFAEIKTGLKTGDTVLTTGAFEAFHRNLQKNLKIAD